MLFRKICLASHYNYISTRLKILIVIAKLIECSGAKSKPCRAVVQPGQVLPPGHQVQQRDLCQQPEERRRQLHAFNFLTRFSIGSVLTNL